MEDGKIGSVHATMFKESENLEGKFSEINGYDFNQGLDYSRLFKSLLTTGFQATNLGEAIEVVNQMLDWRLADEAVGEDCGEEERDVKFREKVNGVNGISGTIHQN